MITVNTVGAFLMFFYTIFYTYYTKPKVYINFLLNLNFKIYFLIKFAIVLAIIGIMLVLSQIYSVDILDPLGFTCVTFNIINFGAPLAGLVCFL